MSDSEKESRSLSPSSMSSSSSSSQTSPWAAYRASPAYQEDLQRLDMISAHKRLKLEHDRDTPSPPPSYSSSSHSQADRLPPYVPPRAYRPQRRPLIDRVNNQWRDEKDDWSVEDSEEESPGCCDFEDDDSCPNVTYEVCTSRKFKRIAVAVLLFFVAVWYVYKWYVWPALGADVWRSGFVDHDNGTYGIQANEQFKDIAQVKTLAPELLPGGKHDPDGQRRLVFVGDVHGCRDSLLQLLEKVHFDSKRDHLICTGDIVSKGPNSIGVLNELIRLNATSVRGNHEDRLLLAAHSHPHLLAPISTSSATNEPLLSIGFTKDAALLRKLSKHQLDYLKSLPLILRVPAREHAIDIENTHLLNEEILVVHAGLVPAVPLHRQDPFFAMNMRSIGRHSHLPSASRERGYPWEDLWNWYQDRIERGKSLKGFHELEKHHDGSTAELFKSVLAGARPDKLMPKPQVVVYGHDSHTGLNLQRYSKGLDSACVRGGKLTALVLDARGEEELVSVECENYR